MGLAAAWACARGGHSVTLFEAGALTNRQGGSHGKARIIRLSYTDPLYVGLAGQAFRAWDDLATVAGRELYRTTGSLDIDLSGQNRFEEHRCALSSANAASRLMTGSEINETYRELALPEAATGLWQADSAILNADLCATVLADEARRHGADLRTHCRVGPVAPGAPIRIETEAGPHAARFLIVAAGDQVPSFASALGTDLALKKSLEQVSFYEPQVPGSHQADGMALLIFHLGNGVLSSVFPIHRDAHVKIMIENNGRDDCDADTLSSGKVREIAETVLPQLPCLRETPNTTDSCHYVLAPRSDFVIDRLPGLDRIIVCSACSGHGFKFAPVLGDIMADMLQNRSAAPTRFAIVSSC